MINPSMVNFILCQPELYFPAFPSLYGFRLGLTTKKKKKNCVQSGGYSEAAAMLFQLLVIGSEREVES